MTQNFIQIPSSPSTTIVPDVPRRYCIFVDNSALASALTLLRSFDQDQTPALCAFVTCGPYGDVAVPSEIVVVPLCDLQGAGARTYSFEQALPGVQVLEFGADGGTFSCFADYACDAVHGATTEMLATQISGWLCVRHLNADGVMINEGSFGTLRVFVNDCTVPEPTAQGGPSQQQPQQQQPYHLVIEPVGLNVSVTDTRANCGTAAVAGLAGLAIGIIIGNR